MILINNEMNY